jgi:nucleotide-binding universal stress UspA family protein
MEVIPMDKSAKQTIKPMSDVRPSTPDAVRPAPHSSDNRDVSGAPAVFKRLLVALDASLLSEQVLELAMDVASACGAEVELIRVLDSSTTSHELVDPLDWQEERAESDAYLRAAAGRFEDRGIPVTWQTAQGAPAEEILRVARIEHMSLIALATHGVGHATRWTLGSTASKVLERAPCSVLLVPSQWKPAAGAVRRVLVPVDGSQRSESAIPVATRIAAERGSELILAHIAQEPQIATRILPSDEERGLIEQLRRRSATRARNYLAELRERTSHDAQAIDVRALSSASPALALLDFAEEIAADLVVVAAHGINNEPDCRFDSITARLLKNLRCPTLVVGEGADTRQTGRWSGSFVADGSDAAGAPAGAIRE